ncbi:hypothetical protein GEMRC1_003459 [Eukaryota sp. GEM-RC1]
MLIHVLFLTSIIFSFSSCSVLSSSTIVSCETSDGVDISCEKKAVILLNLAQSDSPELEFDVSSIDSVDLSSPVSIYCIRSTPEVLFPLHYVEDLPFSYQEKIVGVSALDSCHAPISPDGRSATCGWSLDSKDDPIPYSSGFCCTCRISDIWSSRNRIACSLFAGSWHSAHCQRPLEPSVPTYTIGKGGD